VRRWGHSWSELASAASVSNPFRAGGEALRKVRKRKSEFTKRFQTPSERAVRRCPARRCHWPHTAVVSNPFRAGGEALRLMQIGRWDAIKRFQTPSERAVRRCHGGRSRLVRPDEGFQTPSERAVRRCRHLTRREAGGLSVSNPFRAGGEALRAVNATAKTVSISFKPLQSGR